MTERIPEDNRPGVGNSDSTSDPAMSAQPPRTENTPSEPENGTGIEELRSLLLGEELDRLERSFNDPKEQLQRVSDVLPDAVRLHAKRDDDQLARAMAPNIEETIRQSVKKKPQALADALFPVMGPAIRRSIADTLASFLQTINQTLEHSFSPKSLRWRFESWRTGKPFSEIVLRHTILYRVEQVYLIHTETGLLLQQVAAPAVGVQDGDMVSGMLTAIQDFVKDSFGVSGEDEALRSMSVGDLTVWVEAGPDAAVAIVIRGTPSQDLRTELKDVVEEVHGMVSEELTEFDGDASDFEITTMTLETLLLEQGQDNGGEGGAKKKRKPWIAIAVVGAIATALLIWAILSWNTSRKWKRFLDEMGSRPGYVIAGFDREDDRFRVRGLRDSLLTDAEAEALFEKVGLDSDELDLEFDTYESGHADFVLRRAESKLAPPVGVSLELEAGRLRAVGRAGGAWIEKLRRIGPTIYGIDAVDLSGLERNAADTRASFLRLLELLREAPGITVVGSEELPGEDGRFRVRGLRDSLAEDLARLRASAGLQPDNVELIFEPVLSLDPRIILRRAHRVLQPPAGVQLEMSGRQLFISGQAPEGWAAGLDEKATFIEGLEGVDRTGLQTRADAPPPVMKDSWRRFVAALRAVPGYVISEAEPGASQLSLRGFKDPLAPEITEFMAAEGLTVAEVDARLAFQQSLHPVIVLKRAKLVLLPPPSAKMTFDEGILKVTGHAPRAWCDSLRERASALTGVTGVDRSELLDSAVAALQTRLGAVRAFRLEFAPGVDKVQGEQLPQIRELVKDLGIVLREAFTLGYDLDIQVIALGDGAADDATLRAQRAESARREMVKFDGPLGRRLRVADKAGHDDLKDKTGAVVLRSRLIR